MLSECENIKRRFDRFLQKPLSNIGAAHARTARQDDPHAIEAERLFEQYSRDPAVDSVSPDAFDGRLHSVIVRFKRGGYYRIELDSGQLRSPRSVYRFARSGSAASPRPRREYRDPRGRGPLRVERIRSCHD
jgi:hypothetical protein